MRGRRSGKEKDRGRGGEGREKRDGENEKRLRCRSIMPRDPPSLPPFALCMYTAAANVYFFGRQCNGKAFLSETRDSSVVCKSVHRPKLCANLID